MTRKDFEVIASTINRFIEYMRDQGIGSEITDAKLIMLFDESLQITNPRFKTGLFEEACLNHLSSRKQVIEKKDIEEMMKEKVEYIGKENLGSEYQIKEISKEEYQK